MPSDNGPSAKGWAHKVLQELGLVSLFHAGLDVQLLCLQRLVRLFAYGASTLVLAAFLQALDISRTRIGLFMTLTLVGDTAISFLLALFADGVGRRAVLALGAVLMAGSGVVFATCSNYWILLAAAIFGVISPGGNEIGPFRAVEESTIAHLTDKAKRADVYAWYSLSGNAGTAFGMMTCGWATDAILRANKDLDQVDVYRFVFYAYAVFGLLKLSLVALLSPAVEMEPAPKTPAQPNGGNDRETEPLLQRENDGAQNQQEERSKPKRRWLPQFSKESASIVFTLCFLFGLDSFASGLAPLSWVTFFFKSQYDVPEGKLGSIFFVTSIISAASTLVASSLARRFGNVKTMVFTHLPSAIFLALIPLPGSLPGSILFLVLRACTQSMDVAPRSAFLATILPPAERTSAMGTINVFKTTASSLGPLLTGVLADRSLFWVAFVCAGSLKASYDLGLLGLFLGVERRQAERDRREEEEANAAESQGRV